MAEPMTSADRKAHKASMVVLDDWREILATMDKESGFIGLDLETSGLSFKRNRIAVIAFYGADTNTAGIIHLRGKDAPPEVIEWLGRPGRQLITHNGTAFDIPFLSEYGFAYRQPTLYDSMIGEQVALSTGRKDVRVNLKDTLERRLGVAIPKDVDHATWMLPELDAQQMRYLADDIYYLPRLREAQLARAAEQDARWGKEGQPGVVDAMAFEQRLAPIVAGIMIRGIPISVPALKEYTKKAAEMVPEHEAWLRERFPKLKTLGHAPTLRLAINERYDLDLPDTRADTIKLLAEGQGEAGECAKRLLAYRAGTKRDGMYDDNFINQYTYQGKLYGQLVQVGTETGRFSSRNPNLNQTPRDMRHVFTDDTGELAILACDYSAIEVCVAADLFGDKALLADLESSDPHTATAERMFGQPPEGATPEFIKERRRLAKAGNFNLTFGGGVRTLYNKARADGSKVSYAEVDAFAKEWLARYTGVARARDRAYARADQGRPVPLTFPTGLRRVLTPGPDLRGTTILNNTVQATAAAGLKEAIFELDARGLSQYLALAQHDELMLTVPRALMAEIRPELEAAMIAGMRKVTDGPVRVESKGDGLTWA